MKKLKEISNRTYTDALGIRYNVVCRTYKDGTYSKSKLKFAYSERKGNMCWTTVWHIEGNSKEVLEME